MFLVVHVQQDILTHFQKKSDPNTRMLEELIEVILINKNIMFCSVRRLTIFEVGS
jgi:hypothetical protein